MPRLLLAALLALLPRPARATDTSGLETALGMLAAEGLGKVLEMILRPSKGLELQYQAAGMQAGLLYGTPSSVQNEFYALLGGGFTDQKSNRLHALERQRGWGLGLGWKHFREKTGSGLFVGLRADLWHNTAEWGEPPRQRFGTTDYALLEPTLQLGGRWFQAGDSRTFADLFVSLGREFNLWPNGEELGQGLTLRVGTVLGGK